MLLGPLFKPLLLACETRKMGVSARLDFYFVTRIKANIWPSCQIFTHLRCKTKSDCVFSRKKYKALHLWEYWQGAKFRGGISIQNSPIANNSVLREAYFLLHLTAMHQRQASLMWFIEPGAGKESPLYIEDFLDIPTFSSALY